MIKSDAATTKHIYSGEQRKAITDAENCDKERSGRISKKTYDGHTTLQRDNATAYAVHVLPFDLLVF